MKLSELTALAALSVPGTTSEKPQQTGYNGKAVKLRIELDTKARRGKTMTRVSGFQARPGELDDLASRLKKLCGSGGSTGDNCIDLQGDHREKVQRYLVTLGYSCRVI